MTVYRLTYEVDVVADQIDLALKVDRFALVNAGSEHLHGLLTAEGCVEPTAIEEIPDDECYDEDAEYDRWKERDL